MGLLGVFKVESMSGLQKRNKGGKRTGERADKRTDEGEAHSTSIKGCGKIYVHKI